MLCTHKTTILCQFGLFCHQLTTISPSILNHFWWELYQPRWKDDDRRIARLGIFLRVHHWDLNWVLRFGRRSQNSVNHSRCRATAAKYISFHWKDGKSNPADIPSKHWEFATVWPMLKPIMFWRGETATQLKGSDRIPSTTPGAEPPRDVRDSGSARSHSTHLETSSSDRP